MSLDAFITILKIFLFCQEVNQKKLLRLKLKHTDILWSGGSGLI